MPKNVPASEYTGYTREKTNINARGPVGLFNTLMADSSVAQGLPPATPPPKGYSAISGFSSSNYLTANSDLLDIGGDYTVECFAYMPSFNTSGWRGLFNLGTGFTFNSDVISCPGRTIPSRDYVDKWVHFALTYYGGTLYQYIDGLLVEKTVIAHFSSGSTLYIGNDSEISFIDGKIANFRVSNIARYTRDFTPSLRMVSDEHTTLLILDRIGTNVVQNGTVTITPELIRYKPFIGYGVMSFPEDSFLTANVSSFYTGGDFTIECFAYLFSTGEGCIFADPDYNVELWRDGDDVYYTNDQSLDISYYKERWFHYAIVYKEGQYHLYIDGVDKVSYSAPPMNEILYIGTDKYQYPSEDLVSNLRVSNYARYTRNFTPSLPLTKDANTTFFISDSFENTVFTHGTPQLDRRIMPYKPRATFGMFYDFSDTDYLTVHTRELTMGGDFTIECFAYVDISVDGSIFCIPGAINVGVDSGYIYADVDGLNRVRNIGYLNKWTHIAIVYEVDAYHCFIDGVKFATIEQDRIPTTAILVIGYDNDVALSSGGITSFRVSDIARYTDFFTPSLPLAVDSDTTLFLSEYLSNSGGTATVHLQGEPSVEIDYNQDYQPKIYQRISGFSSVNYLEVERTDLGVGDDYTIECFAYMPSTGFTSGFRDVFWLEGTPAYVGFNSTSIRDDSGNFISRTPYLNKWTHFAIVYTDSTYNVYVDGVKLSSYSGPDIGGSLFIGTSEAPFTGGQITSFRFSDYNRYMGTFTPSMPLFPDEDTTLFVGTSLTNTGGTATVTTQGTLTLTPGPVEYTQVLAQSPVISGFSSTSYLTATIADLQMTEDYTVECFAYIPETSSVSVVFSSGDWGIYINSGYIRWGRDFVPKTPYLNKWTHLAIVYRNSIHYMYVDGVEVGRLLGRTGDDLLYIASQGGYEVFNNGKISNFRVSNYARYTGNFRPAFPLFSDGNTTLLLKDTLAGVTTVGTPTLTSEDISYSRHIVSPNPAMSFPVSSELVVDTESLSLGTAFTIECFAYLGVGATGDLFSDVTSAARISVIEGVIYYGSGTSQSVASSSPFLNKWTHFALLTVGGDYNVYIDGVRPNNNSYSATLTSPLTIGNNSDGNNRLQNGRISGFRISSISRYTANFIPVFPLTSDVNTQLLITDSFTNPAINTLTPGQTRPTVTPEPIVYWHQ